MLKISENIFFFERNAKYILNYHTFSGIPLTPWLQKVIFFSPTAKNVLSKCRVAIAGLKCGHLNKSEERGSLKTPNNLCRQNTLMGHHRILAPHKYGPRPALRTPT